MLPFSVEIKAGESPYRQIVYAATKAIVSGELAPGAAFPSVRELSQALKINPNTAQKVVAELVFKNKNKTRKITKTYVMKTKVRCMQKKVL